MSSTLATKPPQSEGSADTSPTSSKPARLSWLGDLDRTTKLALGVLVFGVILSVAAVAQDRLQGSDSNRDPRKGTVRVIEDEWLFKRCDGDTLIYWNTRGRSSGTALVENSPECR